ncbi:MULTISPECIES: TonB-dependent siderophore receptor [Acinetobacter]|jgi:outer-membrane receptor for ferric coprogen and ferric-rhodotorulic acid|uniref:TonB-dependent siderophore receptor n=1 Tax=Acinetobacter lwoffii TaxID=28090 RepID=A0A1P8KHP1_ACILW|nr:MULTISPECIES: TonB-dependent siderophore receptor [Acinetobacter]ODN54212.1 ligand-gated channel protein [Acinetobacter sp. 51m]APW49196.1 Outer membrane receptor for ferric coprogen and ferric-rhodotorulic acid [Acinetobacter lwoffii]AXX83385.1 TonB-dependent siderophore receptor [Acinetobacter lwoffii]AXX83571.1 TonB-dependent siderophore receptor [Acinetobacter lwoffii]EEY88498.1 TonB-dependent siderophore receptor [Acinetobacter lwoffii SH145]
MSSTVPSSFKLSLLSFSILVTQQSFADDTQQLPTITVTAESEQSELSSEQSKAYIIQNSSTASKLNIPLKETPQTVNVLTRQQLDDFALDNTRDVLRNTPGIIVSNQETERTSYLARGFEISNVLVDGVGIPLEGYNYNNDNPDSFLFDRIEVVKGANALNNGIGDPGATINMIRKRPTQELQAALNASYGSWNTQRYEADVSSPLTQDGKVRGRVFGYQQTGDSYLDRYELEKNGIGAVVEADITDTTLLTAGYTETNHKPNGVNWGSNPLINTEGEQLSYSRNYNYSPSWAHWDSNIKSYFAELEQKLGGDWTAKLTYDEKRTQRDSKLLFLSGKPGANGTSGIFLYPGMYIDDNKEQQASLSFSGTYPLWGQRHEASLGYVWAKNRLDELGYAGSFVNPLTTDLASFTPEEPSWDMSKTSGEMHIRQKNQSLYAATRLHLNDDLKLLLGANYVQAESSGSSYGTDTIYDEDKVLPYAGLTYNFSPEYTGYLSYTSIFRPQTTRADDGSINKPIEGESYEVGVKGSWLDDKLTATMAVFRTEQSNYPLRDSDGIPTLRTTQVSDLRSQGYEFGLAGQLTDHFNLSFGYTQFSLKDLINGGDARTFNPTQSFNLLTTYQVPQLPKLKLGLGVQWQDQTYLDVPEATANGVITQKAGIIEQDAYALVNLMASYELNEHMTLQANGNNLTNEKYLFNFPNQQGFYGAPANYSVAVKFKY